MKANLQLPDSLNSLQDIKDYQRHLSERGYLYHWDDDVFDIVWGNGTIPPSPAQLKQMDKLQDEMWVICRAINWCPFNFAMYLERPKYEAQGDHDTFHSSRNEDEPLWEPALTITFASSNGSLVTGLDGFVLTGESELSDYLCDIARMDIKEINAYLDEHNLPMQDYFDILDCGFWLKDGTYEGPDTEHRDAMFLGGEYAEKYFGAINDRLS